MPLIADSTYAPPALFRSGHLQTIFPAFFRAVEDVSYERERIDTPDGDFLDLDWSAVGTRRVAILSHGLEGDTQRSYVRGMARALNRRGWDALAWNFRGCSGEMNRRLRSYHSGATDDLHVVVNHVLQRGYDTIALIGFSLGGNLTLKYLGEHGEQIDPRIVRAVVFSVPFDLAAGADHIARGANRLYLHNFLRTMRAKILLKKEQFPGQVDVTALHRVTDFHEFDDRYTAPIHGFRDAEEYWQRCSSQRYLDGIRVPTLVVNAADDPLLPAACYPTEAVREHPYVHLEVPLHGGHVGFVDFNKNGDYWSEVRTAAFLDDAG